MRLKPKPHPHCHLLHLLFFRRISHHCITCGLFCLKCVGNENKYMLSTSDKPLGVFAHMTHFSPAGICLFSATTMSMIFVSVCSYPRFTFGVSVVVANNTTTGSPYFCGRTSTEWSAIFSSPSIETRATICLDVGK